MLTSLNIEAGYVFGLLGAGLFMLTGYGVAGYLWWRGRAYTETALAKVYKHEESSDIEGTHYRLQARFHYADEYYEVVGTWTSWPPRQKVGTQVQVYFPPDEPQRAILGRYRSMVPFLGFAAIGSYLFFEVVRQMLAR